MAHRYRTHPRELPVVPAHTMTSLPSTAEASQASPVDELLVHSFGVGHGDCTLLEVLHAGKVGFRLLYDAGSREPVELVKYLEANRRDPPLKDIDIVVLSHVDNDHQGGLHWLFKNHDISLGEFWGPCLPAFRRLKWLFAPRVEKAVDRASELEELLTARNVPVAYPMEHYTHTTASGAVTLTVISPAPRLIRRLFAANAVGISELLTASPVPLEWLVAGASYDEDPDNQTQADDLFRDRTHLGPQDFQSRMPGPNGVDQAQLTQEAAERAGHEWEPEFFGNSVLNDTSVVVVVDVLLDGKHRRRVLLSGDQENWTYIAARHPAGLGVDVLKVPHHGGRVYLGDKREAMEQMYLWLRPRIAMVSAKGLHGLPRNRFRDAVRAVGTTLLCPNCRQVERITAPPLADERTSCFSAYNCGAVAQRQRTTLSLTAANENSDSAACLQGQGHRGVAPIVVLEQRLIEPDEAFVRWTRTETEKQARWIRKKLDDRRAQFLEAIGRATNPTLAATRCAPVKWTHLEALARAEGHHHLVADPGPVLKYAASRQLVWSSETRYGSNCPDELCRPLSDTEYEGVLRWLLGIPHLVLSVSSFDWDWAESDNRLALLDASDMFGLCSVVAGKLSIPRVFVERELLPRFKVAIAAAFSARACNGREAHRPVSPETSKVLLHLYRRDLAVPDIFDSSWRAHIWDSSYELNESGMKFIVEQATDNVLISIKERQHSDSGLAADWGMFETLFERFDLKRELPKVEEGAFLKAFSQAMWKDLWKAS